MAQVDKKSYSLRGYSQPERWVSYGSQLRTALDLEPESVLEVGVGDKVFGSYIKNNTNISYKSVDIALDLAPDIVGDVLKLPCADRSFDVVCAFEVLEHVPFADLDRALGELDRVSRRHAVISLPHFGPPVRFLLKLPFLPYFRLAFKLPYPKEHAFNGQHYWEMGKRGYPARKVREIIRRHFQIRREFVPFGSPYHHFFVLDKRS
ncbi:MAG: class I SAM-dependent methyltransferase [Minisyncoccia bacterium]|jgi:ubiquinone/menaquinone biosynthesis C-methylase UbiE